MPVTTWIRRLVLAGLLLGFVVVVFGAYVRLTAAGLGCPDWPGCYGHLTPSGAEHSGAAQTAYPDRPMQMGKAWREMLHRYAATTLGLIIVVIAALAALTRRERIVSPGYALGLLGIVVLQGLLGMLTVTWNLKPLIVTLHLLFGLTTLGLLWWLWLSLSARRAYPPLAGFAAERTGSRFLPSARHFGRSGQRVGPQTLVLMAIIALALQIALGGWTSSNYAAVACPDLPRCQGEWWPQADYQDAFILWRGLDVNYEGGVLESPARVAIHLVHRMGAVLASLALAFASFSVLRTPSLARARPASFAVLIALALQLAIGMSMVWKGFPLPLATAHNAGAALLLLCALALYRQTLRYG